MSQAVGLQLRSALSVPVVPLRERQRWSFYCGRQLPLGCVWKDCLRPSDSRHRL